MSPKGPPLSFLLFRYRMRVYKSKGSLLLHFSALCDIFRKKFFFSKISSFFPKKCFALLLHIKVVKLKEDSIHSLQEHVIANLKTHYFFSKDCAKFRLETSMELHVSHLS